jgi:Acetyltransferase (GNAT) domain
MASALPLHDDRYRRNLGDGLVLRWSTAEDADHIAALYANVFRSSAEAAPNEFLPAWAREMLGGRHPNISPPDFAVVEQSQSGEIVAATCLLRYQCAFEEIPFGFGRPETVATLPDYRRRGLIRAIFELVHAKSEAGGDLMQGITGIPYYYRQFGYEYAAELASAFTIAFADIPDAGKDVPEPYRLREATLGDLPLMHRLWDRDRTGAALSTIFDEAYWRWMARTDEPESTRRWGCYIIVDASDSPAGFLPLVRRRWSASVLVDGVFIERGVPLVGALPSVLRGVRAVAEVAQSTPPDAPPASSIALRVGSDHPVLRSLGEVRMVERDRYAWYIRVADLPRFTRHVAPALERRLANSPQSGYSGELTLDFYRGGLRLVFEHGALTAAEDWRVPLWSEAKAGFPPLVFLQLLCGYRSLDELCAAYPDVWTRGDGAPLLDALFPKRPSRLIPLD